MSSQSKAGAFSTIASGVEGANRGIMTREEAQLRKARGTEELQKIQKRQELGLQDQELELLKQQNSEVMRKLDQNETYQAFQMYNSDPDVRHLQRLVKGNPRIAEAWGVLDVLPVDPRNDAAILNKEGLNPEWFNQDSPSANMFNKRFVKFLDSDGNWKVGDIRLLQAGTGYSRYSSALDRQVELEESQIIKNLTSGKGKDTALVQESGAVAEAKKRIAEGKGTQADKELIAGWNSKLGGKDVGKLEHADAVTQEMLTSVGGEEKFWSLDMSNSDTRNKLYSSMNKIMKLQGTEWTSKDRAELHDIRVLTAMGEPGTDLSEQETGVIDSLLLNVKKYISDEVTGVDATSAYAAFRNTVRHALYGSALTEAEITSFNEAFGTLGQKLGPVLEQFKTSLNQVKAKLSSISDLQNPYVSKYFLGADQDQLDKMILGLDQRIEYLSKTGPRPETKEEKKQRALQKMRGAK